MYVSLGIQTRYLSLEKAHFQVNATNRLLEILLFQNQFGYAHDDGYGKRTAKALD